MTEKTGNDLEVERIMRMSLRELFDYVLTDPSILTDSYYKVFSNAVYARDAQLIDQELQT